MDEMNLTLPPELETALTGFYSAPEPDAAFASRLELELRRRQTSLLQPAANPLKRSSFMQTLRARPALTILLVLLALSLLTGVAYAINRLAGFIPGFGFTADAQAVYVLSEPAQAEQDGVTLRVENAVSDRDKFWVAITQSGKIDTQQDNYSRALVRLPDGTRIDYQQGGATDPSADPQKMTFEFPALPARADALTFHYEISTSDGKVIWMVDIPLQLRPIRSDELIPAQATETAPLQSETHDGLSIVLENVAPASDKTVLQVALRYDQPGVLLNSDWNVILTGADGTTYPLTQVMSDSSNQTKTYETTAFKGGEELTLSLTAFPDPANLPLSLDFSAESPSFTFDPGPNPQIGQSWQLDETIQVGKYPFHVTGAKLERNGEQAKLRFSAASTESVQGFMLNNPADARVTGSEGEVPVQNGNLLSTVLLSGIPDQPITLHFMRVYYSAHGTWQIHWQAPAAPEGVNVGPTKTPPPTAAPFVTPTLTSSDPLLLKVQALAQKFDATFQQGPGWVHWVSETSTENMQAGQTFPPPYLKNEQWSEIDADGYVLRGLYLDKDVNGQIIQQAASVGNYTINFTTGDSGFNETAKYRLSLDMLTQDLNQAAQYKTLVTSENIKCEAVPVPVRGADGSACLLVTLLDSFAQPVQNPGEAQSFYGAGRRTWINLQTGQQVKTQSFWRLQDGSERVDYTYKPILVEKVNAPPQEILDILAKVVVP